MKGIIVIDVPVYETEDFGHMDIRADVKVKAYNNLDFKSYELQHIRVEPMPPYMMSAVASFTDGTSKVLTSEEYARGYNACIKEIIRNGEKE